MKGPSSSFPAVCMLGQLLPRRDGCSGWQQPGFGRSEHLPVSSAKIMRKTLISWRTQPSGKERTTITSLLRLHRRVSWRRDRSNFRPAEDSQSHWAEIKARCVTRCIVHSSSTSRLAFSDIPCGIAADCEELLCVLAVVCPGLQSLGATNTTTF